MLKAAFVWGIWWFSLNFHLVKNLGLFRSGVSPDILSLLDWSCAAESQLVSLAALLSGCFFQRFMKTPPRLTTCHKGLFLLHPHSDSSFMLKLHGFVPGKVLNHLASLNKEAIKVHIPFFLKKHLSQLNRDHLTNCLLLIQHEWNTINSHSSAALIQNY